MKRFVLAGALTCVLSSTALAGLIPSTDFVPPPPPPESTALAGEIATGDSTSPGEIPTSDVAVLLAMLDLAF